MLEDTNRFYSIEVEKKGDLYISRKNTENAFLRFEQSIIHEQYLNHLFEKFNYLCTSSASVKRAARKLYPDTSSVYFTTRQLIAVTELHTLFYSEGRKIVPLNISSLLTEKSLAYTSLLRSMHNLCLKLN
jgi:hypothetical protein